MKKSYGRNPINIYIFLLMIHLIFFGNIMADNTYVLDKNTTIKQPKPPIIVDSKLKEKFKQIDNLFIQLDAGILSEMDFFRKLGEKKLSVKDLVEFKANVINNESKNKKNYQNGIDIWNVKYRHMEQNLMKKRREVILNIWDNVASEYIKNHPDCNTIARMDVGGWVKESKEKMRFEGDIDFTVVMVDTSDSIEIRNRFNQKVNESFKMDMVAIDALATAHRAATLSVYIGDYGANWAEIDAINRGKMHIITRNEDGTLAYRKATDAEKSVLFAVLKNNVAVSKGEPDRLAEILYEKDMPKPKYDMEPGISLEFLRHITSDAFNSKLALHEKVIKMSKYLNRSVAEHNKILQSAGAKSVPIDTEISRYANDIIRFKQSSALGPETILLRIMRRTGYLLNDNSWVLHPEKSLGQIQKRMSKVIIHNITEGIDAYKKVAKGKSTIAEQDKVLKEMLDILEEEYKAFSDEGMEDKFPDKALNEMHELAKYFNENNIKISPAEQKKIKELLEKISDNPKAANTWMGILYQHALKVYGSVDKAIDFVNKGLDILDDNSVQKIRSSMVGIKIDVNGKIVSISIGSINNYLNGTILGAVGNSVPYKGLNLALEGKAYYDAVMNADTWSHGFVNLGYELMSRRLPGYAATGAWVNGDYGRLAVELTYLVFPLTAIPEGLYGMTKGAAEWGVAKLDEWEYNTMVDTLYDSATFQKKDSKWYMTGLSYPCPNPKKTIQLTIENKKIKPKDKQIKSKDIQIKPKDNLYKILISCPHISSILYPKIHNHPALKQFEEMLDSPSVSTGKAEILGFGAGWPYLYIGLSQYGKKLYKLYLKKVDEVTLEYFKGVIDGLEKRKAWETGTGYAEIIKLEKKLGCRKPLIEYTKNINLSGYLSEHILGGDNFKEDIKKDAKRFQDVIDTYKKIEVYNKKILILKKKWKANFLEEQIPYCRIKSIKKVEKNTSKLLNELNQGVEKEKKYVEKTIGMNAKYEDFQPLIKTRLCMIYFKKQKSQKEKRSYKRCYEEYQDIKKKLKEKSSLFTAKINIEPNKNEFCPGEKIKLFVSYNVRRENSEVSWTILNEKGGIEDRLKEGLKTTWKPQYSGEKTIHSVVKIPFSKDVKGVYESKRDLHKKVLIKPENECPKLEIVLDTGGVEQIDKDSRVTIETKIISLSAGSPPVNRYFWYENGKQVYSSNQSSYIFSGKKKGGEVVTVEAVARDVNGNLSNKAMLKIKVNEEVRNALQVKIVPYNRTVNKNTFLSIKDNETILLEAKVAAKENSGKLKFRWSINKKTVFGDEGYRAIFKGKSWSGKKVVIDVLVIDEKNREGTASLTINVKPSQGINIELEEHKNIVTERDNLKLRVKKTKQMNNKKYHYTWKRDGRVVVDKMKFDYFNITDFQGLKGKSVKFSVEVFDEANESIGETSTVIQVVSSKKENEKDIQKKSTTLKITAPSSNQETPETTILIAGEVSNFENVASMQMIVNGVKYQMKPSAKFSQKMPIVPGKNTLQVAAKLKDGSVVHSQIVTVKSTQSAENRYRFTLRWNTARTDIDLWLVGPTGESCSYQGNSSFAELDRDEKEVGYGPENIFIAQLTDYGKYNVRVQYYADHNKDDSEKEIPTTPTEAEVLFFVDNKLYKRWKGSLTSEKQWWNVYSFTYGMDIEINSPVKTSVKIGETLNLTAKVKESSEGLGEMLKGKHVFRWVNDNGVEFSPVDTLKPETTALFTRPGKVKIRVQVMAKKGDELKVIGESKDITIDVIGVTYKLKVDPPKPMVGQEAVITVVPNYDVDKKTLDFRWEISGPVLRQGLMEAGNTWKYGVTGKASKPITVVARGRTPFHGDDAGEATITFTPQLYIVKAVKQGNAYGGMSVRVYDPQLRDFVEAPQGTVITDQAIRLRATIEGEPLPSDIRWKWTVNDGTSLNNEISREPTVMRHESGTIVAKVEARNKEGVILGSGEISFSVFESDHGPKASQIKLKDAQEAWNDGDIDKAVILISEAHKINPKDDTINHEFERMRKDSINIKSLLRDAKLLKDAKKLDKAELCANDALKLNTKYKPAIKLHNEIIRLIKRQTLKANKLLQEARKLWKEGKLQQAIAKVAQAQKLVEKDKKITKTLKAMQMQKKDLDNKLRKVEKLINKDKLKEAQKVLDRAARISDKYEKYKEVLKQLIDAKEKEKRIIKLLKDAKALKDAGKLDKAVAVLKKGSKQFPGAKKIDKLLKEVQKQQEDARKKMTEGQIQWKNGMLDKAVSILKKAVKVDPSNRQIAKVLKAMQGQKKMMNDTLKKVDQLIEHKKFKQAKGLLKKAERISSKYPPYIEMLNKLDNAKKKAGKELIKKVEDLWNEGSLGDAIAVLKTGSKQYSDNKNIKQALQKMQENKKRVDDEIDKAKSLIGQKKIAEAKNLLKKAGEVSKKYPPYIEVMKKLNLEEAKVDDIRKILKEAKQEWEKEQSEVAIKKLDEIFNIDPDYIEAINLKKKWQDILDKRKLPPAKPGIIPDSNDKNITAPEKPPHSHNVDGKTITATFNPPSSNIWKKYSIHLTADNFGVDAKTFREVLSSVSTFRIRTEMHDGDDIGGIDTVRIGNRYFSDFNSGTDGWSAAGDGTMEWISSGGISGGYLQISDWASGDWHWAVAPTNWSGDWGGLIGSSIDFYYKTDHPSYSSVVEISSKQQNRLVLLAKPITIPEGGLTSVSISPYPTSSKNLVVSLKSSNTKCSTVPGEVIVPAGQVNVEIKVSAVEDAKACNSVITASADGYRESRITLSVGEKVGSSNVAIITSGKNTSSTTYTPNTKGDVFKGGHWAGASGGSDWLQKDFASPQLVTGIYIGRASTDITTEGFKLVLKLRKENGEWITISELHDTNINRTKLSGGAIGKSIPPYTKHIAPAIKATAFRLEFYGHGWFDATDIKIYTKPNINNHTPDEGVVNTATKAGTGSRREDGEAIYRGKGSRRNPGAPKSVYNGSDSLSLIQKVFEPGEKIALRFKASSDYPENSWVGMFKANLPHDGMSANNNKELAYYYLKNKAGGTFEFKAPTKEGEYDFRMFERSSGKETVTVPFSVKVDQAAAQLALPKTTFEPGEKIVLQFKASPNYPRTSWIGMFKADLPHDGMSANNNKELAYHLLENNATGTFEFKAPTKEGEYDFRMFERSSGKEVATLRFKIIDKLISQTSVGKVTKEEGTDIVKKKESIEQKKNISEEKSIKKFEGTLTGSWKDKEGWATGSFVMNISESGNISGHYWGDDKGQLHGSVNRSGTLNMKSGGGAAGSGKWGGSIIFDKSGKLQGNGTWSVEGYTGTWSGSGKNRETVENNDAMVPVHIQTSTSFKNNVGRGNIVTSYVTLSFWNVGAAVSKYAYAEMNVKSVSSLNGATQEMHYTGTFTGGPNGTIELSDGRVSVTLKVLDGKRVQVDGQNVYFEIPDPSVFQ